MTRQPLNFFQFVHRALSTYRWMGSLTASLMFSAVFAFGVFYSRLSSEEHTLRAVSPYLSTLAESQDRPELLRVLQSLSQARGNQIALVHDGVLLAHSTDLASLDRPFEMQKSWAHLFGVDAVGWDLVLKMPLAHVGNLQTHAEIYETMPILPTLRAAGIAALLAFLTLIAASYLSAWRMRAAIREALAPLESLHQEILGLGTGKPGIQTHELPVLELEEIRQSILKTHVSLENARDRLAEERAKKLSAEAYKRTIHDLHTPVAALRQNARLLADLTLDAESRLEAASGLPRIADQILNQVTAAKKNLEYQPSALCESDLRWCVVDSVNQVVASMRTQGGGNASKNVEVTCPESPVIAPHDAPLLQRAIVNLVENAAAAAQSRVRVSVVPSPAGVGTSILVSDDGPGMQDTLVALHLQGRGKSSKADRQAFGLVSASHIVRTHGGRIIYRKSEELGGACFEIRLGVS